MKTDTKKIFVLGAGGWGTAIAVLLANNSFRPTLWTYEEDLIRTLRLKHKNNIYLKGVTIPDNVDFTSELSMETIADARLMVMAVPVKFIRTTLQKLPRDLFKKLPVVSVAKGIENDTLLRPSEIIREVLDAKNVAVLSGPSHAEEVARGLPASVVIASDKKKLAEEAQSIFNSNCFRVYTNDDIVGVELGGGLKNVIAIAAGICDGLKLGDNAKSALLTRGIVEIARLGTAMGGKKETFFGLSGIGDLITTCMSPFGRNREVGLRIGKGEKLKDILGTMKMVAEGVWTAKSVHAFAIRHKVDVPISMEVHKVLFENKNPADAVRDLMTRRTKAE